MSVKTSRNTKWVVDSVTYSYNNEFKVTDYIEKNLLETLKRNSS